MNAIEKLSKVNRYLRDFTVDGISAVVVTRQNDAVTKLSRKAGDQIVAARPELSATGNVDNLDPSITLAFFALAKIDGPGMTEQIENETYDRLAGICNSILSKFTEDISGSSCPALCGLDLSSVDVVPEAGIFGGWCGYSIEITLE